LTVTEFSPAWPVRGRCTHPTARRWLAQRWIFRHCVAVWHPRPDAHAASPRTTTSTSESLASSSSSRTRAMPYSSTGRAATSSRLAPGGL